MNPRTIRFLKSRFQAYYKSAPISLPDHLPHREWAFLLFDDLPEKFMRRHKAFGSSGEAFDYLKAMAPAHVYSSTAYYEYPNARKMKDKNWLGAELIFDLDADHLPGASHNYAEMLEQVKKEALKLLDFLLEDFGFLESELELVFSGGRGYHFHIRSPKVFGLESSERREIVNYISGQDLDFRYFFKDVAMDGDFGTGSQSFKGKKNVPLKCTLVGYETGWGKRIARYLVASMREETKKKYKKDMFPELRKNEAIAENKVKNIIKIAQNETALADILEQGRLDFDVRNFKEIAEYFMQESKANFLARYGANVDEPVTGDIKRLIRVPGSLHGGSGMQVKKLKLSELESFKPLEEALVFGEKPVKLKVLKPFALELKGKDLKVEEGIQEVPEYAAIYLMCRGVAEYGQ